jgi:hypothetical protein
MRVPIPKSGEPRLNQHGTPFWRGNQLVQTKIKELMIWRTKIQAREQRHGRTQGFNLLQMSPNWSLGSKVGLRMLTVAAISGPERLGNCGSLWSPNCTHSLPAPTSAPSRMDDMLGFSSLANHGG